MILMADIQCYVQKKNTALKTGPFFIANFLDFLYSKHHPTELKFVLGAYPSNRIRHCMLGTCVCINKCQYF